VGDIWSLYNSVDRLDRVKMLGNRNRFRNDDDIEMLLEIASNRGAKIRGDPDHGVSVGKLADLIVKSSDMPTQSVIDQPPAAAHLHFHKRQPVAENGKYLVP